MQSSARIASLILMVSGLVLVSPVRAQEQPAPECWELADEGDLTWSGCIFRPAAGALGNPDVIYLFTALGEKARSWIEEEDETEYADFRAAWPKLQTAFEGKGGHPQMNGGTQMTRALPTVVSITLDPANLSLLNDRRLAFFREKLLPTIETKLGFNPAKRHLIGHSMGAFNAWRAATAPGERVASLALECPVLTPLGPVATDKDIADVARANSADFQMVEFLVLGVKSNFATAAEWEAANPLTTADRGVLPKIPVFLAPNLDDQFGFFDGGHALHKTLNLGGYRLNYVPTPGQHCENMGGARLAKFVFGVVSAHAK